MRDEVVHPAQRLASNDSAAMVIAVVDGQRGIAGEMTNGGAARAWYRLHLTCWSDPDLTFETVVTTMVKHYLVTFYNSKKHKEGGGGRLVYYGESLPSNVLP